jgi:signal transduction histidine kinase
MPAPPRRWNRQDALAFAYFWRGPEHLAGPLKLEWRIIAARWIALLCFYPGLALSSVTEQQRLAADIIVLAGVLYNLAIIWLIFARPDFIASGYPTALGDLALNSAMLITLGGGFASGYSYIFFALVISVAMRFGHRMALGVGAIVVAINALQVVVTGNEFDSGFVFRGLVLALTAILAGYLREQAQLANAELQESNLALQTAYGELHHAHQQLLTLDAAKTNFVANVSHELRTPLTSIRAYSELLLTYDDSPEVQREFVGIINAESERLTRLVSNVLDIMKIESGSVELRMSALDMAELLRYTVTMYAPLAEQRGIALKLALPLALPPVCGDRDRLLQVLGNLVSNALKFTVRGAITLTTEVTGLELRIAVADTGPGITSDEQGRIFEKFYQGGRLLTEKPGGTGLGLAICKEIIEQHRGRIWVESRLGQGSTFYIALGIPSERTAVPEVALPETSLPQPVPGPVRGEMVAAPPAPVAT